MLHCADLLYTGQDGIYLGKPLHGIKLLVLGNDLSEVAGEGSGELYIGGIPARYGHYINRPDLDKEKYCEHPSCGRLFKTGDAARIDGKGRIWLSGRTDNVVKLHGQRIDLGEVENAVGSFAGITAGAARMQGEGASACLAAYYLSDEDVDEAKLRSFLSEKLPCYMVPSFILRLTELPLNSNGKIDRQALPEIRAEDRTSAYAAPETVQETLLCRAFEDMLKPGRAVGRNDSFFDLGGDSFMGGKLISDFLKSGWKLTM